MTVMAKNQQSISSVCQLITCPSTNTKQPRGYLFAIAPSILQCSSIQRWWSLVEDRIGPSPELDDFDLWGSSWALLTIRAEFRSVRTAFVKVSSRYFTVCSFKIFRGIVTIDRKSSEKFHRIVLKIFDRVRASLHVGRLHERFSIFEENFCLVKRILVTIVFPFSCERIERNFCRSFSNDKQQRRALVEEAFPKEGAYIWP